MSERQVDWHEGMFLVPQQFQAERRYQEHIAHRSAKCDVHHNWGVRTIEIDEIALGNHRLVVRQLRARLRDGTLVATPEDGVLPVLDLKPGFEKSNQVTVYLAVPVLRLGRTNLAAGADAHAARYLSDVVEVEDENAGGNLQRVKVRLLNIRLLLSTEDQTGFETIPIARLERAVRAESAPVLDETFFPAALSCDAWKPLQEGVLQSLYDRIGKKIDILAEQVVSRNLTLDSQGAGDRTVLFQLSILNEAYSLLGVLAFTVGVHPYTAYLELARMLGQLSVFGPTRRPPQVPCYDHDDLGGCFYRVKQHLEALLGVVVEPEYKERPFEGSGLRMQVALEPAWVEPIWQLFVGVRSRLDPEACIALLTRAGQLDMKIGSADRVDAIFRLGLAGLHFEYAARPPRWLPVQPGLIYFQISREAVDEEWQNVQKSLTLAMRLNESLISGNIQGQQTLSIRTGGQSTTLQFTLYVAPRR
jgi:type VI secretion system protein ImpJ